MITRMEVFTAQQGVPELPLGGLTPNDDPIQVRGIDGLGPVKADITTSQFASADGEIYQGASVGKRNILLSLALNPDWIQYTMSDLRLKLYRYFTPKAWVKFRFYSDHMSTVDIEGYVESFEPDIFAKDPTYQISVICPRPDFIDSQPTFLTGLVDDGDPETEVAFTYVGNVNTGFEVRVESSDDVPAYTGSLFVNNKVPQLQRFIIDPVTIDLTKNFRLSTIKSAKRAQNVATDGTVLNLLSHVTPASNWPVIVPGPNLFSVTATEPGQIWTLAYFNRFVGL